jgi:hypothetical protein
MLLVWTNRTQSSQLSTEKRWRNKTIKKQQSQQESHVFRLCLAFNVYLRSSAAFFKFRSVGLSTVSNFVIILSLCCYVCMCLG